MKNLSLWILAGLNLALLAGLLSSWIGQSQAIAQNRRPPEYVLIPGELTGITSDVIFVVDSANNLLGGFSYDTNANRLDVMQMQDLSRLFQAQAEPRNNAVPGIGTSPRR